jgi:hypothetical protein
MAKEAAIRRSQPMIDVKATETKIARGAARAAFAVSSDIWAAESSGYAILSYQAASKITSVTYNPSGSTLAM